MQAVLDLAPQTHIAQDCLDIGGNLFPISESVLAQGKLQVLPDREGERIRLLENHADAAAQADHIGVRSQHVEAVEADASRHSTSGDEIGQAVQGREETGLAAP